MYFRDCVTNFWRKGMNPWQQPPSNSLQCSLAPMSLHSEQDIYPFSHCCTAKPHEEPHDKAEIIIRNSLHVMQSMWSKILGSIQHGLSEAIIMGNELYHISPQPPWLFYIGYYIHLYSSNTRYSIKRGLLWHDMTPNCGIVLILWYSTQTDWMWLRTHF